MPTKRVRRFTAWSYSRLVKWEECPFRAKAEFLDKTFKMPEGPAIQRGKVIEAEVYAFIFKPKVTKLPESGKLFNEELQALKKIAKGVLNNRDLAFDRDWKPCAWDDWDRAWLRVKMDLLWTSTRADPFKLATSKKDCVVRLSDLKTGKIYEDKLDQLDLYETAGLLLEPGLLVPADVSAAQMWYLDQGETRPESSWTSLVRGNVEKAKKQWERRVKPMMLDEAFIPKPGWYCKRCPLSKAAGGNCPY